MPADDYSAPAFLTAKQLARSVLIIRGMALGLAVLAASFAVAAMLDILDSASDPKLIVGYAIFVLAVGFGAFRLWRSADTGDPSVLKPGDPPGLRLLDALPAKTGPVRVPLAEPSGDVIVLTNDGMHLPAGIIATRGLGRRVEEGKAALAGLTPLVVPCFLPWSELVKWSYCTNAEGSPASHRLDLTDHRVLSISKATLGDHYVSLLDAVRSVGGQPVEVVLPADSSESYIV
ncbi:MAG: hypothetical protein Q4P07_07785 [Ornithinimicrobium sp.]|uniref:hypothetical protein n=1 Tax=Ornithinimicrobium sp. TaxID=1977084 RepID=UPI0026E08808|nr:hypothetical protein [Ornithinimicrobium sp.]MDO5740035.1 hypothetical protein [Ornithinimicrobium sp.]